MSSPVILRLLDLPSRWETLDPIADRLRAVVQRLLPPSGLVDVLHGTRVGHPVHPPLAEAALSGWTGAAVLAAAELAWPDRFAESRGANSPRGGSLDQRNLLALVGLASAAPTVLTGFADWADLHEDQQRTGLVHAATMATTAGLSVAARLTRRSRTSAVLDITVGLVAAMGAAFGGHLAFRWAAGPNHAEAFAHLAKEGWSRVCSAGDLEGGEPIPAVAGDEPVVVVRHGDTVHALADRCSHLGGPLHEGELTVVGDTPCLACPWHHSTFALDDGRVVRGPAVAPQPVLDVRITDGSVEVRPRPLPGVAGR